MAKEEVLIDIQIDEGESVESINSLRAAVREMTKARNDANLQTAEGRAQVQALNQAIDANNAKIKANVDALTKQKINVGNYKDEIVNASKELNVFGVNVGSASTKLASFANPATAAVGILTGLASAYARSTTGAKDLEFASNQLSIATGILSEKFATLFSSAEDGEGFFSQMVDSLLFKIAPELAIQSNIAASAQEKIQDINREEIALRSTINDRLEDNQEKLTRIQSEQSSIAEKTRLTQEIQENLRLNSKEQIDLKKQELDQLRIILSLDANNEDKQQAVLEKKREISDIERNTVKAIERIQKLQDNVVEGQLKRIANEEEVNQKLIIQNDILLAQEEMKRMADEQKALRAIDLTKLNEETQVINLESLDAYLNDESELLNKEYEIYAANEKKKIALTQITEQQKLGIVSGAAGQFSKILGKQTAEGKVLASIQAGVDTYAGANAQLKLPFPYNLFAAATTIATGIANIAEINKFEKGGVLFNNGGVLNGPSHADGGIPFSVGGRLGFEAEGGEAIINKRSTAMFRPLLSRINAAGGGVEFETGGILGFPSSVVDSSAAPPFDLTRLEQTIASLKIQVAVTDINDGQKNYAEIVDRAQF